MRTHMTLLLYSILKRTILPKCQSFTPRISSQKLNAILSHSTNKMQPNVSKQIEQTLEPCVELMKRLISEYNDLWIDKGGIQSLAQGIVYWKPPTTVYERLQSELNDTNNELHLYNPISGVPSNIERLKHKLKQENGLDGVDVMMTAGANQAFVNCVLTLLSKEGDACVVFRPFYFNHVMALQMSRGEESVLVGPTVDGIPDIAWLEDQLVKDENIKMVTIVNPGNPTGVSMTRKQIQDFVQLTKQHSVWLVFDNTYEHFDHTKANSSPNDTIPFWCSNESHVINIFTFSKGYSLAGFRIGYLAVSLHSNDMFNQMQKVQDTIPICVSRIAQCAAMGALDAGPDWVKEKVKTLDVGRGAILDALSCLDEIIGGSGAMYVMGKLPSYYNDDKEVARILVRDYGIAVIPGSFCGFPGYIRVCYSNLPPDDCIVAAERLKDGLEFIVRK